MLVDGIDLREYDVREYRRHVGYVPQEPYLFSGTVLDNIRLSRPEADLAEVRAAALELGIDDLLSSLPEGYDTRVHERGSRLSAGERQLVAFARAFFAHPEILILDEATSSVDPGTEHRLESALDRLLQGRTALGDRPPAVDRGDGRPDHSHGRRTHRRRRRPRRAPGHTAARTRSCTTRNSWPKTWRRSRPAAGTDAV